jgi:peptidoglycan/xylan/chitin deacetylase (PgdA/CDA1 family)
MRQFARRVRDDLRSTSERLANVVAPPVIVLIYHRVIALPADPQMLAVHPDRFREQLRALKSCFEVRRFEESWSDVRRPTVVLTFDDGYADNLHFALPILEENGVPATFFIATGYIGGEREFWWDELDRLLLLASGGPRLEALVPLVLPRAYALDDAAARDALYRDIHPLMKKVSIADREHVLAELARVMRGVPPARESHRVLGLDELRRLAASPIATIGAHTVSHQPLSSLSLQEQQHEIERSRNALVSWLKRDVAVFSYPFGARADYEPGTVDLCRRAGFTRVASNVQGVYRRWTDPFQVPRFLVRDWSGPDLMRRLKFFAGL